MIYVVSNKPNKIDITLLDSVISFACDLLELDVDLTFEFKPLKGHQYGFCDYDEDEVVIILAKRLSKDNLIRTLFHELVHVKQYVDGRLQHGQIWNGSKVDCDYENLPWEVEAFQLEQKMVDGYSKSV